VDAECSRTEGCIQVFGAEGSESLDQDAGLILAHFV
jgi:hypothetical protein